MKRTKSYYAKHQRRMRVRRVEEPAPPAARPQRRYVTQSHAVGVPDVDRRALWTLGIATATLIVVTVLKHLKRK